MKSRKTRSRMKVKCRRTGTPPMLKAPTLPAAILGPDLSSFGTYCLDAWAADQDSRRNRRDRQYTHDLMAMADHVTVLPEELPILPGGLESLDFLGIHSYTVGFQMNLPSRFT